MDPGQLRFQAHSPADAAQMSALLALGMICAVKSNAVSADYACAKLFRPSFLGRLRRLGVDEEFCESLAEALELDDVASLVESALPSLLERLTEILTQYLASTEQARHDEPRYCWLDGYGTHREDPP